MSLALRTFISISNYFHLISQTWDIHLSNIESHASYQQLDTLPRLSSKSRASTYVEMKLMLPERT